jgi:DUF4097 and DUF4098 domain-containing protein YvlB
MRKGLRTLKNPSILTLGKILILFLIFSGFAFAQIAPKTKPHPIPPKTNLPDAPPPTTNDDIPFEKSLAVEAKVNLRLCVNEGNVKINGWERNEVRVFIRNGTKANFNVNAKDKKSAKPVLVTLEGVRTDGEKGFKDNRLCLSGEEIELDVPNQATLRLEGIDVRIDVDSIARASLFNDTGDISVKNISQKIEIKTYEGNVRVENSEASVSLESLNGGILVHNVEPSEIGDAFRAKTNSGALTLQEVKHQLVEATSISGIIRFTGEIRPEGEYKFNNTSGQILLAIPLESSCLVQVLAQKGRFSYDVPLKILQEEVTPSIRRLIGEMGKGEASINLASSTGRIFIKKIN